MTTNSHPSDADGYPPGEPERSLRLSIAEGLLASAHTAVTSGSLVTGFALLLGANDFHLGVLSALAASATLGCLISAYWVGHLRRRKGLVVWGTVWQRLIWGLLGLIPFVVSRGRTGVLLFLGLATAAACLFHIANNAWMAWMTDLVPFTRRGRYFGVRNTLLGLVSQAGAFGSARTIDHFKACGREELGFLAIFAASSLLALLSSVILARQCEPGWHAEQPLPILQLLRRPLGKANFRRFLGFLLLWGAAIGVAGPFWVAHMLKNLRMSYADVALYGIIGVVAGLFSQIGWGRMIDRVGSQTVLLINHVGVALLPLLWLFATPDFLLLIWVDAFLSGLFWPGFGLAQFNLALAISPARNRSAYLALQTVVGGLAGLLAAPLAGLLAQSLSGTSWTVGGLALCNYNYCSWQAPSCACCSSHWPDPCARPPTPIRPAPRQRTQSPRCPPPSIRRPDKHREHPTGKVIRRRK